MRGRQRASGPCAAVGLALIGLHGCSETTDELGTRQTPIVNGVEDPDDPAVVALLADGEQYCSGTLVSPTVVVTAAHCLPPNYPVDPFDIAIYFGEQVGQPGELRVADEVRPHPDWIETNNANDLGLIALSSEAPTAPLPMLVGPGPRSGEPVKLVGFGFTGNGVGDSGEKRVGMTAIDRVTESNLYLIPDPALTCSGDSGGPLFVERDGGWVLAGIHSRSDCVDASIDERVDVHLRAEIEPFIAAHGGTCEGGACDRCAGPSCGGDVVGGCAAGGRPGELAALAVGLALAARRRRRAGRRRSRG